MIEEEKEEKKDIVLEVQDVIISHKTEVEKEESDGKDRT